MSLAVGVAAASSSKTMGLDEKKNTEIAEVSDKNSPPSPDLETEKEPNNVINATDDDDDDELGRKIDLGPQVSLKDQIEKDKDDESLRRWKEQLLGSVDFDSVGESLEPDVKILSLAIKSPGRSDIVLSVPENGKPKGLWFTLKEGSRYSLQFTFQVSHNIVSGLKYRNSVWKAGLKVDSMKEMIGTFSPQLEPYTHEMPEDTTPSGIFARGSYSARSKFIDDDKKCYLEINYTFDIRREWQETEMNR